jgi:pilus assembly protein CpaC
VRFNQILVVVIILTVAPWIYSNAWSATPPKESIKSVTQRSIALSAGKWGVMTVAEPLMRISVGDPTVVDVTLVKPQELYLIGKKVGATNIFVWSKKGNLAVIDVDVGADTQSLQDKLLELMPQEAAIEVRSVGSALALVGLVKDAGRVHRAMNIAEAYLGRPALNMLRTQSTPQVLLEVKVAEVSKKLSDKLGSAVSVSGTRGNFSYSMLSSLLTGGAVSTPAGVGGGIVLQDGSSSVSLEAEIKNGLIKILAQPNIIALSGHEGSFLAGGKIYIPVPQAGAGGITSITLEEREYGVGLRFLPTVLDDNIIHLRVTPEVSELSPEGTSVRIGGSVNVLPTITTRRASTTVELRDGESFAIGGLIRNNTAESIGGVPLLSDLPILGALFRSSEFASDRSELMFIVTPRLVSPVQTGLAIPNSNYRTPTRSEFMLEGKLEGRDPDVPGQDSDRAETSSNPTRESTP